MKLSQFDVVHTREVIDLFTDVFTASENRSEGELIGRLVADLIATTKPEELTGFVATSDDVIVGCIFFSRFVVPDGQTAFMLSPVAVATSVQGTGIGQQLIAYGLNQLKARGVDLAFTYGDPNYYSKVGFSQISESVVQAPYALSQPEGWLAQSLAGSSIEAMQGSTFCVEAFNDQRLW